MCTLQTPNLGLYYLQTPGPFVRSAGRLTLSDHPRIMSNRSYSQGKQHMRVTLYTKPGCHLCEDVLVILDRLTPQYSLEVHEVNILDDAALYEAYHAKIPMLAIEDGRLATLEAPMDEA